MSSINVFDSRFIAYLPSTYFQYVEIFFGGRGGEGGFLEIFANRQKKKSFQK